MDNDVFIHLTRDPDVGAVVVGGDNDFNYYK